MNVTLRSSPLEVLRCSKKMTQFTGKNLCRSLLTKLQVLGPQIYQKRLWCRCFLVSFAKFFIASFFKEDLQAVVSEDTENVKKLQKSLQSRTKYWNQRKEIKQNWTQPEKFVSAHGSLHAILIFSNYFLIFNDLQS